MPQHDFSPLFNRYPEIIAQMPAIFTSHRFIACLAQRCQREYVEALYAYRECAQHGAERPFQVVHGILARRLNRHPELVRRLRSRAPSADVFGQPAECVEWHKVAEPLLPGVSD